MCFYLFPRLRVSGGCPDLGRSGRGVGSISWNGDPAQVPGGDGAAGHRSLTSFVFQQEEPLALLQDGIRALPGPG